jgi:hypothetical protein
MKRLRAEGPARIYESVAARFERPVVLDTSKSLSWFEDVLPARASNADMVMLHLVKHPMRHVASYVNNRFVVEQRLIAKIDSGTLSRAEIGARLQYAMKSLHEIERRTDAFEALFKKHPEMRVHRVRYEDVVADAGRGISVVLRLLSLDAQVDPASFWSHPAHFLGGNRGVREQMKSEGVVNVSKFTRYRNAYYSAKRIATDEKYLDTFTAEERLEIAAADIYRRLCDRFGYDADLDRSSAARADHG